MVYTPCAALVMITVQNTDSVFRVQYSLCSYDQDTVHNTSGIFRVRCKTLYMRLACTYLPLGRKHFVAPVLWS